MTGRPEAALVWFKRDLRLHDHEPLALAAETGPVVGLFVYEPSLLMSAEFDTAHLVFINESLAPLIAAFERRGGVFLTRTGEVVDVLETLADEIRITGLFSHEETGNDLTYRRDQAVGRWCEARRVPWREFRQDGVIRRLRSRNGWAARWQQTMSRKTPPTPERFLSPRGLTSEGIRTPESLDLGPSTKTDVQRGGEAQGLATLESFLESRGVNYRSDMSSPVEGWTGCSRLSPYLAWGCLSMRTVSRAAAERTATLRALRHTGLPFDKRWGPSLRSFEGRLRWHCHFMQKLEDEPRIEFENLARACDGLREEFTATPAAAERLEAWKAGRTGYPMVDACLRCVAATGWLNFRMRAMVMSFASYHLWLHWRPTAVWLGRQFLDFEPGIHFSQCQMQSGTTGINTIRIYSPAKQVIDQDPQGLFIKKWVPELAAVPPAWLPEPHRMPHDVQQAAGCRIGHDYPTPIVDHATAYREAREKMSRLRKTASSRSEARAVFVRHGSRKHRGRKRVAATVSPLLPGLS